MIGQRPKTTIVVATIRPCYKKRDTICVLPGYVTERANRHCTLTNGTEKWRGVLFIIFILRGFFLSKIKPKSSNHERFFQFFSHFSSLLDGKLLLDICRHLSALTGHSFLHFWQRMHSVAFFRLRESLFTSTFIGQTFKHLPQ